MELSHVKGLGPAKQESLKAAGIKTVEALAEVDLRKDPDVPGVSKEALKTYKQRARQTLAGTNAPGGAAKKTAKGTKKSTKGTAKKTAKGTKKSTKGTAKKSTKGTAKKSTKGTAKKSAKSTKTSTQGTKAAAKTATPSGNGSSGSTTSGKSTTGTTSTRKSSGSNKKGWLRRILRR